MARTPEDVIAEIKMQLQETRGRSVQQLARLFQKHDSGNGKFDFNQWSELLTKGGIFLRTFDLRTLFRNFAKAELIDCEMFINAILKSKLVGRRQRIAKKAFAQFDQTGHDIALLKSMKTVYDPSIHPKVLSGDMKEEEAYKEFVGKLDGSRFGQPKAKPVKVTLEEFMEYMAEIGADIPEDNDFVDMMQKAWKIRETPTKEMILLDRKHVDALKDTIREKVRQRTDSQKFENMTMYRACRHFDLSNSGDIDLQEFSNAITVLGIHLRPEDERALFESFNPQNGAITYAEFSNALFADPEPDQSTSMFKTIGRTHAVPAGKAKCLAPIRRSKIPSWALESVEIYRRRRPSPLLRGAANAMMAGAAMG
mmetsp:Transcript_21574/g.43317  ORF Transcript_21574/g.43317 Transcript_21574/m.43317 type:complete len:367 (-) Transcript_21574:436-1536(-)|eukprot:CAMPEP_0167824418 /NCGR_PEP_ID=MMETSP0112_2-20121227/8777_1 /TAXON_ID=91324 /ORGANISM="Lotharella globosa, Strain CCCM811" /LENGTH=366 /DNA_ID=CAMNT_0007726367 /DNA_START=1 /DNA_END=1101 /DNA_ORIENTATION=+